MANQSPAPTRFSALRSPLGVSLFILTTVVGLVLDQWSKMYAWSRLVSRAWQDSDGRWRVDSDTYTFVPGWLHFHVTLNYGAVFGVGQGKRYLFIIVSIAAIFFISYLFSVSGRQRVYQFILGMLLAGVLGNLYDRYEYGYVRDMIHGLPRWEHLFPYIFNVADTLLCTGVGMMVVHSFLHAGGEKRPKK